MPLAGSPAATKPRRAALIAATLTVSLAVSGALLGGCERAQQPVEKKQSAQDSGPAPAPLARPLVAVRGMTSLADVRTAWGTPPDIETEQDECGTALDEEFVQQYRYPDAVIEVGRSGDAIIRALRGIPEGLTLKLDGHDITADSTRTELKNTYAKHSRWKEAEAPGKVRTPADRAEGDPLDQLYYTSLYTLDGDGDQWRFYFLGERLVGYAYWVGC